MDVLREAPPVYVVHDFLSIEECGFMMNKTVPHSEATAPPTRAHPNQTASSNQGPS